MNVIRLWIEGVIEHTLGGKKNTALLAFQSSDYQPFYWRNDSNRPFCAQPFEQRDQNTGVLTPSKEAVAFITPAVAKRLRLLMVQLTYSSHLSD